MIDLIVALSYSMLRMFSAYILSLACSILIGVAMARSKPVEALLLPVIDVLQSIPILGFFPVALLLLMYLAPGYLGVELAIVFLISTSMVWNMIFGVYTSIKSLDPAIYDLVRVYRFTTVTTLFRVYVPASIKAIIANSIISWAGGWFFITSSEIITASTIRIKVAGIGAYILDSFIRGDAEGMCVGLGVLVASVMATYILLWNPMFEETGAIKLVSLSGAYKYVKRAIIFTYDHLVTSIEALNLLLRKVKSRLPPVTGSARAVLWATIIVLLLIAVTQCLLREPVPGAVLRYSLNVSIIPGALLLSIALSLSRVVGVVFISLLISLLLSYVSYVSILSGRPTLKYTVFAGEILASIPAILWWPILSSLLELGPLGACAVSLVVFLQGSLWYSFFNIMLFGISSVRSDFIELANVYRIRGWYFIKYLFIPMLLPSIATSAFSSWGGAWNSTIVAEYFSTDSVAVDLGGVGALMDIASSRGNMGELAILVIVLSTLIATINKAVWKQLFSKVTGRFLVE